MKREPWCDYLHRYMAVSLDENLKNVVYFAIYINLFSYTVTPS